MADDLDDDDMDLIAPRSFAPEVSATCVQVRDTLLPEWSDQNEAADDLVELTADGMAVMDGAFTPLDLFRVAEALMECGRRIAPAMGRPAKPPIDAAPQPLAALHRLRFVAGIVPGTAGGEALAACEDAFALYHRTMVVAAEEGRRNRATIETMTGKLARLRAAIEQADRTDDCSIVLEKLMQVVTD